MIRRRHVPPSVSLAEISPEVAKLSRRKVLRNGLSLGSLALLTGCDLSTHSGVDAALWAMLGFDDRVQAALLGDAKRDASRVREAHFPGSTGECCACSASGLWSLYPVARASQNSPPKNRPCD